MREEEKRETWVWRKGETEQIKRGRREDIDK